MGWFYLTFLVFSGLSVELLTHAGLPDLLQLDALDLSGPAAGWSLRRRAQPDEMLSPLRLDDAGRYRLPLLGVESLQLISFANVWLKAEQLLTFSTCTCVAFSAAMIDCI